MLKRAKASPVAAEKDPKVGYRLLDYTRSEAQPESRDARRERRRMLADRITEYADYAFIVLYALLAVRFLLRLLAANEKAGFVQLIHHITAPFYGPFVDILPNVPVREGMLVEPSIVFCMFTYLLLHIGIRRLLHVVMATGRML